MAKINSYIISLTWKRASAFKFYSNSVIPYLLKKAPRLLLNFSRQVGRLIEGGAYLKIWRHKKNNFF